MSIRQRTGEAVLSGILHSRHHYHQAGKDSRAGVFVADAESR